MRTIDAIHILKGVADLAGLDADFIGDDDFPVIRRALSRALSEAYEFAEWPDLVRIEKRYFRDLYTAGTTYSAPTATAVSEVYFPQTSKYYQALRALPLTVSSITRSGTTATVTTSASHLLATGNQVSISGASQSDYNITATVTVTGATTFTYTVANSPATPATGTIKCTVDPADANDNTQKVYWADSETSYSGDSWSSTATNTLGDIRYWPGTDRYYVYYNSTNSSGNQPTNTTYWAILTEFDRYVAWAQTGKTNLNGASILDVFTASPRLTTRAKRLNYGLSSNGIQVLEPASLCYVYYRQKPPQLKGDTYVSTTDYAVDDQVYYATGVPGNFYDMTTDAAAGTAPTDTTKWTIVSIPYFFERYLVQAGYAAWLRHDGQDDKAMIEENEADDLLWEQKQQLTGVQNQRYRTEVLTR